MSSKHIDEVVASLQALYVMHRSGICLFSESFSEQGIDKDLATGFLSAIFMYAQEMGSGEIERIELDEFKFIFREIGDQLLVISVDRKLPLDEAQMLIDQIKERFDYLAKQDSGVQLETLFIDLGRNINFDMLRGMREALKSKEEEESSDSEKRWIRATKLSPRLPNIKFWQAVQAVLINFTKANSIEGFISKVSFGKKSGAICVGNIGRDFSLQVLDGVAPLAEQFAQLKEPSPMEFGPKHIVTMVSPNHEIIMIGVDSSETALNKAIPHMRRVMKFTIGQHAKLGT